MLKPLVSALSIAPLVWSLGAGAAHHETPPGTGHQGASASAAQMERELSQATQAMQRYAADRRDAAVQKVAEAIDALDARLDRLRAEARQMGRHASAVTREKTRSTLDALQAQRTDLAEWYGALKHGSAGAWSEVSEGFMEAYRSYVDALGMAEREAGSGTK